MDIIMKQVNFTNDELHAFSEHVTWCIYEQDQPVDDNLQSFIDKVLYDNQHPEVKDYAECVDTLTDSMYGTNEYDKIPKRY
jgi:hypothetical protein